AHRHMNRPPHRSSAPPPSSSHFIPPPFFALAFLPFFPRPSPRSSNAPPSSVSGFFFAPAAMRAVSFFAGSASGASVTAPHLGHLHFLPARSSASLSGASQAEQLNAIVIGEVSRRTRCAAAYRLKALRSCLLSSVPLMVISTFTVLPLAVTLAVSRSGASLPPSPVL